ncbi:MAG: hypothetical protein DLM72_08145 [Candidatus Nitrosopolaris wilkensis]|nr:MAG: hypothetical protein DLM72_08145 [Candidatus Nitrosopolaris wilkensis]
MLEERRSVIKQRIIRTLLNNPEGNLSKYRLAQLSQSKFSSVHRVLKQLETKGLIEQTRVKDFKQLIIIWQKWQVKPHRSEYVIKNPIEILRSTDLQYALTTYQAENTVQNYLFPSRTDFYISPEDRILWHKMFSSEGLVGKGNTRILIGDKHVFLSDILSQWINDCFYSSAYIRFI